MAASHLEPILVGGSNFAPTAGLRCGFGGFEAHGSATAAKISTRATFLSAFSVECAPPPRWWEEAHVHMTHDGGASWSGPGAPLVKLYNTSQLADVRSVSPAALPVDGSAGSLTLRGEHFFRPPRSAAGPGEASAVGEGVGEGAGGAGTDRLVCRFDRLPEPTTTGPQRASESEAHSEGYRVQGTGESEARSEGYVVSAATLFDSKHARCSTPAAVTPHTAAVSLSFDGGLTSGTSTLLTFFDAAAPPLIVAVRPPDGERTATTSVTLLGSNFAPPATATALVCRFGDAVAPATFLHSAAIACHAPPAATLGTVAVALSTDGGNSWAGGAHSAGGSTAVGFVYFDAALRPSLSSSSPAWAPVVGGARLTLHGSNFVPPTAAARERAASQQRPARTLAADDAAEATAAEPNRAAATHTDAVAAVLSSGARCVFDAAGRTVATSPASYASFSTVHCLAPAVPANTADATLYLTSADGLASVGTPFTFVDESRPPLLSAVEPQGMPLGSPVVRAWLRVQGRGAVPSLAWVGVPQLPSFTCTAGPIRDRRVA